MRVFRFRLDPVLGLRRRALDRIRRQLAQEVAHAEQLGREAGLARERAATAQAELEERSRGGLSAGEFTSQSDALSRQVELRKLAECACQGAVGAASHTRQAVAVAHTEVRSLEVLREKALEAYRLEQQREEQKLFDEIASQHQRRRSGVRPSGGETR